MVPFKGRSRFKVYMKDKPTNWGFKLYVFCEGKTGYVYTLEMYCADRRFSNKAVDVTMRLMQPLLNKGHRLFVDDYYCCLKLWNRLKSSHTTLVGTCRRNRIGMPRDLFEDRQRPGDLDCRRKGHLIITRWMDKREVITLSSCHLPQLRETIGRSEVKEKPLRCDRLCEAHVWSGPLRPAHFFFFTMRRKQHKWWKKPSLHLLTIVSIQIMILLNVHRKYDGRRTITMSQFVKDLIVSLASIEDTTAEAEDVVHLPLIRLKERHFIET
ncbi:PiggyBac transposable element-derived protein 4 [Plakobranchus ocellatus]|uniref:PiggyBac transposable element-derived protein 4 n=1 Tax=Plakobranchus ocellatus TaxID=259542 RepID=A0AAV3YSP9_9GAST|nr:PiggyBac transposable element-derived protein 4 [Plakobranchus ocellatus]